MLWPRMAQDQYNGCQPRRHHAIKHIINLILKFLVGTCAGCGRCLKTMMIHAGQGSQIEYAHHTQKSPDCLRSTGCMWQADGGYITLASLISHGLEAPGIDKYIKECQKCYFKCHGCHQMEDGGCGASTGRRPGRHANGSMKPLAKQHSAGF